MVWCPTCAEEVEVDYSEAQAMTCCCNCGRVLEDTAFSSDVTFMKGADGEGELVGQFVSETGEVRGLQRMAGGKVWNSRGDSHEMTVNKGRQELQVMIDQFNIRPAQDVLEAAHRLYRLAVQNGFTRGRVVPQVAACCLYIICRQEAKPFMLIDLSDMLQVNMYKLGGVYLQLTKLLRIEDHPALTRPIDPSLYLVRFVRKLDARIPGETKDSSEQKLSNTALRLIGQMKRDWMQTGRRPAGICGAALWMACHMHGVYKTKADVMSVVHVGWVTLDKRVREFSANQAASLTIKEFEAAAKAAEDEQEQLLELMASKNLPALPAPPAAAAAGDQEQQEGDAADEGADGSTQQLQRSNVCDHVREGVTHCAMGMCKECFRDFLRTSGGIWGDTANPPAFQRAVAALTDGGGEDDADDEAVRLLLPAPGHGDDDEIMAEMQAEQQQQQQQRGRKVSKAAAAAARGRGRGRGRARGRRGRPPKSAAAGLVDEGGLDAAAGGRGSSAEDDVAAQVAELDSALNQLHDAVLQQGDGEQQQQPEDEAEQQQQQQHEQDELAHQQQQPDRNGDEAEFGSSLLGYGTAYNYKEQQARPLPPAKRRKTAAPGSQQPAGPATPAAAAAGSSRAAAAGGDVDDDEADYAAALARSSTEGLGVRLDAAAANLVQDSVGGLTAETGAIIPVPMPDHDQDDDEAADGDHDDDDGNQDGEDGAGDSSSSGTDLEAVDDDEIASYIRPENEVKLKEVLWNHINKDWIAAQEQKKARAEAAAAAAAMEASIHRENLAAVGGAAADDGAAEGVAAAEQAAAGAGSSKKKGGAGRKINRPQPLPEANDATAAARANMEAMKKLSDKINYKVLDDLFDTTSLTATGAPGTTTGRKGRTAGGVGNSGEAAGGAGNSSSFQSALINQQEQRQAAEAAAEERARQQFEAEQQRRGGSGFGLGLGGLGGAAAAGGVGGAGGGGLHSSSGRLGGLRAGGGSRLGGLRR